MGLAFSFFKGDLVGERLVPSEGLCRWLRGAIMDFNLDVAIFLGELELGCGDESIIEVIVQKPEIEARSDEVYLQDDCMIN